MAQQTEIESLKEYRDRITNFSNEFDFGLFLYILKRSLIWVIACFFVSIVGAALYLRYTPPNFQSKSVIQLSEIDQANRLLSVNSGAEETKTEAKVELLRSKLLVERTVRQLPLQVSYYAKGEILTSEHYMSSSYKVRVMEVINPAVQDKPIYLKSDGPGLISLTYDGKKVGGFEIGKEIITPDFRIEIAIADMEYLSSAFTDYELYFVINSLSSLTNRFATGLEVRILSNTARTVEIAYKDNNPYIARDFIRAHAKEFLIYDLEKKQESDNNVLLFLNTQIDTVYNRLKDSEVRLNEYKRANRINDLDRVGDVYLNRLSSLEEEIINLEIEERLLNEVENLTKKSTNEVEIYNLIPLVAGSKYESSLSKMLDKLHTLIVDRSEAMYNVKESNVHIKAIDFQIGVQKELILQTITSLRDQLEERKLQISEKLNSAEGSYYGIPEKEIEFARLQRLFTINEKYYTLLLQKSIEYRISKEGFVSNNQVLEEARTPLVPVSPKKNIIWITFILAGFLISFLIIAMRYLLHNKITSMNDIVRVSDATISSLGIVPRFKEDIPVSMLIIDKNPRSVIAESFRSIRTNLQFFDKESGSKVAAITSTISGEGKTFVSLNLAGILAYGGKRVVVCDLDMRKPKIHKGFSIENAEGMSTLLIGKCTIDQAIRKSQLENLHFITAGPIPPNPSELIISGRLKTIIDDLKSRYDVVVLDTPPAGLVTDAVTVLPMADYPIYIFRSDFSKKQFVQVADKLINENKINLSVILNGVDLDRNKYSYKYSYGYGYGYGYGIGGYYEDNKHASSRKKRSRLSRILKR